MVPVHQWNREGDFRGMSEGVGVLEGGNREEGKESCSSLPSSSSKKWHQHTRGMDTGAEEKAGTLRKGKERQGPLALRK